MRCSSLERGLLIVNQLRPSLALTQPGEVVLEKQIDAKE